MSNLNLNNNNRLNQINIQNNIYNQYMQVNLMSNYQAEIMRMNHFTNMEQRNSNLYSPEVYMPLTEESTVGLLDKFFSVKNVAQLLLILWFLFLNVVIYFVKIILKIV